MEYNYAIVVPPKKGKASFMAEMKAGVIIDRAKERTKLLQDPEIALKPLAPLLIEALEGAGLETTSREMNGKVVILVRARTTQGYMCQVDKKKLAERARATGTYFKGDKNAGQSHGQRGAGTRLYAKLCAWNPEGEEDKGARNPYAFLFAPYAPAIAHLLVQHEGSPFSRLDRLKLTTRGVERAVLDSAEIRKHWDDSDDDPTETAAPWTGVGSLLLNKNIDAAFPLHLDAATGVTRDKLLAKLSHEEKVWTRSYEKFVEHDVCSYFGVGIAFYFSFLSFYSRYLRFLAVVGVFLAISRRFGAEIELTLAASAFMVAWSFTMLRQWSDREARLALRWGMLATSKSAKVPRAAFVGAPGVVDPVTGEDAPYFPPSLRAQRQRASRSLVGLGLGVAFVNVVLCKFIRILLVKHHLSALPSTILSAIVVFFLNNLALGVATHCADFENHKYDEDYESAVFDYVFVFRFVNSFATMFYTAYLKAPLEGPCDSFQEAGHATAVFLIVQMFVGNALECLPAFLKYRQLKDTQDLTDFDRAQSQLQLAESPTVDVLDDYLEMVIQYGYCVLFFVTFPPAAFLAVLNNLLEAKVDAIKRLSKRRPVPTDQSDIRTYTGALRLLAWLAIFNNAALIAFVSGVVKDTERQNEVFVSTLLIGCLIAILTARGTTRLPYDVKLQMQRQAYVLSPQSKLFPELHDNPQQPKKQGFLF